MRLAEKTSSKDLTQSGLQSHSQKRRQGAMPNFACKEKSLAGVGISTFAEDGKRYRSNAEHIHACLEHLQKIPNAHLDLRLSKKLQLFPKTTDSATK